jgi:hypothetical protein
VDGRVVHLEAIFPIGRAPRAFFPIVQWIAIHLEGCGGVWTGVLWHDRLRSGLLLDRKGNRPVSHPFRRLRHVHTTLWQGRPPCRQKLHKRLLGRPGKGPRCHLQRPLGPLWHTDERDCPDDIQPVRPHTRSALLQFALIPPDPTQE